MPREPPGLAGATPDRASPARRWRDERGRLRTPETLVARADAPPRVPIVRCAARSRRLAVRAPPPRPPPLPRPPPPAPPAVPVVWFVCGGAGAPPRRGRGGGEGLS